MNDNQSKIDHRTSTVALKHSMVKQPIHKHLLLVGIKQEISTDQKEQNGGGVGKAVTTHLQHLLEALLDGVH